MSKTNSNTIGIDIGGSKIRGVIWNGKKALAAYEMPTPKNKKRFIAVVKKISEKLIKKSNTLAIGIGIAGVVRGTKVLHATNISYLKNFDFKSFLKTPTHFSDVTSESRSEPRHNVGVDNDARCFARAEYELGAGKSAKRLLAVTIGTGVGRAFVKGGVVQRIKRFEREELWEKEYQKLRDAHDTTLPQFVAKNLMHIIRQYHPSVVVVGGSMQAKKGFFVALKKALVTLSKLQHLTVGVRRTKFGKNAGAIGAALLRNNT